MRSLASSIRDLKRSHIRLTIEARMRSFDSKGSSSEDEIFKELCFCLLTANYSAEGGIRIQEKIGDGFISLGQARLAARLRDLGYRFPNARARYIVEARRHRNKMRAALRLPSAEAREWFAENVLGL